MPRSRRRPRTGRPRLTRMDAAVDAMLPFGFPEGKIKKHVKELLKVYGGDEAWPFIEEFSYKVLLETILEDRDDEEEKLLEDESCGMEEPSSNGASDAEKNTFPPDIIESSAAAAVAGSIQLPVPLLPPLPPPPPPPPPPFDDTGLPPPLVVAAASRRRRVPCYGWIDSDDDGDEVEFVYLRPMERGVRATVGVTKWSQKRRSRWDVKPADL